MFIVGLPRSGTTMTEHILAAHSQVFGAGELTLARDDLWSLGTRPPGEHKSRLFRGCRAKHFGDLRNNTSTS